MPTRPRGAFSLDDANAFGGWEAPTLDPRAAGVPEPVGQSYGEGYIPLPGVSDANYYPWGLHHPCTCPDGSDPSGVAAIGMFPAPNYPLGQAKWGARFLAAMRLQRQYALADEDVHRDMQSGNPGLVPNENSMTADLLSPLRDWGKSMGIKRYQGRG